MKPAVLTDLESNQEYVLPEDNKPKKIGRRPDCDISLSYRTVSGYHATIIHEKGGSVYIWDNNSTNGTYITRGNTNEEIDVQENTRQLKTRTQVFKGDVIRLGKNTRLKLDTRDVEAERKAKEKQKLEDTLLDM